MNRRVILPVTMELLSDAIFGSGFSIPGGEDIAVCQDTQGLPYVKGSTVKGLLRESLELLSVWTGGNTDDISAMLGQEGWPGTAEERRLRFTSLTLDNPPPSPEDCYDVRTFTAVEKGIVKEGTLRTAACVRKGLTFSGQLECDSEDVALLSDALAGIKWAGTLRNRGFGYLRFQAGMPIPLRKEQPVRTGQCIRYRLHSELPVMITDLNRSRDNSFETQGFLPGSAIRGAVMAQLSREDPAWFDKHKAELLSVRFLDAVPVVGAGVPLPSVRGFYEDKQESKLDPNVVLGEKVIPGHKRAKLGMFCALDGKRILYWKAASGGTMRIKKGRSGKDAAPFQVRYLEAGQEFEGYVLLDHPALTQKIADAMGDTIWLGADRHAGFGKCGVTLEEAERPAWLEKYGFQSQSEIGTTLYLLAISPFTMLDERGEPCGLNETQLARKLGVASVSVRGCATALTQNGNYNRVWQCRSASVRLYDRGSLFRLECSEAPTLEAVHRVQEEGLGICRAEGLGQILFLPESWLRAEQKTDLGTGKAGQPSQMPQAAEIRRAKYKWVENTVGKLQSYGLSKSQLGSIQAWCEKAIGQKGDCGALYDHLEHNLQNRGAEHGRRFREIDRLIRATLETPLAETLSGKDGRSVAIGDDSTLERLKLLVLLFDYSRKGKEER